MRFARFAIAALAVVAVTLHTPAASAQELTGAGATFPQPIYTKWFEAYHAAHPNVTVNYQALGSSAGIAQYKARTVDFGATDAPLTDADLASMPVRTLQLPTVAGAIVLAYNITGVGPGLRLSGDVIADIYLGVIRNWNDARILRQNPGIRLPNLPITVVHRADGSGTTNHFTHYLAAVSPAWSARVGAGKSVSWPIGVGGAQNAGVAGLVRNSPGAVGYVELAYAVQNRLPYGPIRNRAGDYVLASIATTQAAEEASAGILRRDARTPIVDGPGVNSYPIVGMTFMLVPEQPRDAAKGRALTDMLRWAMGPGQQMAAGLLYAPLPVSLAAANDRALGAVRVSMR